MAAGRAASRLGLATWLAVLVPAALLAGAWASEIWGGLHPCEMCWWQRDAHMVALAFAFVALAVALRGGDRPSDLVRPLVWVAALAILVSGGIGVYHAGVEAHVFPGMTQCTATAKGTPAQLIEQIMNAPTIRCDTVQWRFLGISMAGWNAILSIGFDLWILWLSLTRPRPRR